MNYLELCGSLSLKEYGYLEVKAIVS